MVFGEQAFDAEHAETHLVLVSRGHQYFDAETGVSKVKRE